MKSTNTVLAVAIVIAGFASFGCGSDVSSGVTIADVREECDLFQTLAIGEPLSESEFNVLFITAESLRDDGLLESDYIAEKVSRCNETIVTAAALDQCFVCLISIVAAVWN